MTGHGGDPAAPGPQGQAPRPPPPVQLLRAVRGSAAPLVLRSIWPGISNTPSCSSGLLCQKAGYGQVPPPGHAPCSPEVSRLF